MTVPVKGTCRNGTRRRVRLPGRKRLNALTVKQFYHMHESGPAIAARDGGGSRCRMLRRAPLVTTMPHRAVAAVFAALAIAAGVFLGLAGWPAADRTLEYAGLIAAAILTSACAMPRPAIKDWATMTPAFVVDFIALLLLGPHAATVIAGLTDSNSDQPIVRALVNTAIVLPALQAAGAAYVALGGTFGRFVWPMHGVAIAAAIVSYCLVRSVAVEIVLPLIQREPINRAWPLNLVRGCPTYFIGASIAVALAELIDRRAWELLPVIAAPLFFAYRAYTAQPSRLTVADENPCAVSALEPGMCTIDGKGVITSWNGTLAAMLACPRAQAQNRALAMALPPLAKTELPRAIDDAMKSRNPRTLPQIALPMTAGTRVFEIKLLPGGAAVTLVWRDVTEQARAEYALRRSEERFALTAEGSNDGLWEFDVRTRECYFSGRWRTLVGLPAFAGVGHLDEWMTRVHPDDAATLKEALEAHLAGRTEHILQEH